MVLTSPYRYANIILQNVHLFEYNFCYLSIDINIIPTGCLAAPRAVLCNPGNGIRIALTRSLFAGPDRLSDRSPPPWDPQAGPMRPRALPRHLGDDAGVEPVGGAPVHGDPAQDAGGRCRGHGAGGCSFPLLQIWWVRFYQMCLMRAFVFVKHWVQTHYCSGTWWHFEKTMFTIGLTIPH